MEYNAGFVTSLILLPKFLIEAVWRPFLVIERALSSEENWEYHYPKLEFVAIFIVSLFTLYVYSMVATDRLAPGEIEIPRLFDKESDFANSAFYGVAIPIGLSIPLAIIWRIFTGKQFNLKTANAAGRMIVVVTFFISVSYLLDAIGYSIVSGDAVSYSNSGSYTTLHAPGWVTDTIYIGCYTSFAIAILYFSIAAYRFRYQEQIDTLH